MIVVTFYLSGDPYIIPSFIDHYLDQLNSCIQSVWALDWFEAVPCLNRFIDIIIIDYCDDEFEQMKNSTDSVWYVLLLSTL